MSQSNGDQPAPQSHEFDDDCVHCHFDGAEAAYYSQRGYAHEYVNTKVCPGARL